MTTETVTAIVYTFSTEAARVMCGGAPALASDRKLIGYYVSAPLGRRPSIVDDVTAARRRERGYDRQARRWHGRGAGYDARIVPIYSDGSASGPWANEAVAFLATLAPATLRRRGISSPSISAVG